MANISTNPLPGDLLGQINVDFYRRAASEGMGLTPYLNQHYDTGGGDDGLDVFERLLLQANVRSSSDPQAGIWATEFGAFAEGPARMLLPEWQARVYRSVTHRQRSTAPILTWSDNILNTSGRPYFDAPGAGWDFTPSPAVPLNQLVAATTGISGDSYRAYYLTDNPAETRQVRIAEGDLIPTMRLLTGERAINLHKYGRGLEVSYEQLRRQRLDVVALLIRRMALQAEVDKVTALVSVMINGDGNANTAATSYNLTTLDSAAVAGTLTLFGWLAFKLKMTGIYRPLLAMTPEATALQVMTLSSGTANIPASVLMAGTGLAGVVPVPTILRDSTALAIVDAVGALKILLVDPTWSLLRIVEIGSDITEVEQFAKNQTFITFVTEVEGFAVLDPHAAIILNVNA